MKLGKLTGVVLTIAGLCLWIASCGGSNDHIVNIAFTPIPAPTPVPKLCGNGIVDTVVGEQCDPAAAENTCAAGQSCICCVCLADGEELGDRDFAITKPPSSFQSTGLGGDVSTTWVGGPLMIHAARPDPDLLPEETCSANLALTEDGIFGFGAIDGTTACAKLFAAGSSGSVDCDGGTAHDVRLTQDSNGSGPESPVEIETGLGDPAAAGPGAATLTFERGVFVRLPFGSSTADCAGLDYEHPHDIPGVLTVVDGPLAFTTTTGTNVVTNPKQGGDSIMISAMGENFSCGSWTDPNSAGLIIGPISGLDTIIGDTANALVLGSQP